MHKENVRVKLDTALEKYSLENNIGVVSRPVGKCQRNPSVTEKSFFLCFFMSCVILHCKSPLLIRSSLPKCPSNLAGETKSFLWNNCTFIPPLFFFRAGVLWGCFLFTWMAYKFKVIFLQVCGLSQQTEEVQISHSAYWLELDNFFICCTS